MTTWDAAIVGGRCGGGTLATLLARAGWRVVLIERDHEPGDTVSTHIIFPDTLHRLDELGILSRLRAAHDIPLLGYSWRVLGHEVAGTFTPIGGYDRASCIRRRVLDRALLDAATAAGADVRLGYEVTGLLGGGTPEDPVRGVVLDTGARVHARWVIGADGLRSTVARRLGLPARRPLRAGQAFLFAYWRGLPPSEWVRFDIHESLGLLSSPCEDGIHLLCVIGRPSLTRGSNATRAARYHEALRQFPATLNPRLLDHAERISDLTVVPETMPRGLHRRVEGAGWALIGDAAQFTHPATAQGIGEAIAQAGHVAGALTTRGNLSGYEAWRDEHTAGHYEWSFSMGELAADNTAHSVFAGLAADPRTALRWRDLHTKRLRPDEVYTRQRLARWRAAWAYEDGRRRVTALVSDLSAAQLTTVVPACPDWTVQDLLAHLVGLAADVTVGDGYHHGAVLAWTDRRLAADLDRWTSKQVDSRRGHGIAQLLREWDERGGDLEAALRRGDGFAAREPDWVLGSPAADLGVHLHDLREALDRPGDTTAAVTTYAFAAYREWLSQRLHAAGMPALCLDDDTKQWILGPGEPVARVRADRFELLRMVTGRRSAEQIRRLDWTDDPEPYLAVISPYPLSRHREPNPDGRLGQCRVSRG